MFVKTNNQSHCCSVLCSIQALFAHYSLSSPQTFDYYSFFFFLNESPSDFILWRIRNTRWIKLLHLAATLWYIKWKKNVHKKVYIIVFKSLIINFFVYRRFTNFFLFKKYETKTNLRDVLHYFFLFFISLTILALHSADKVKFFFRCLRKKA